MELYYIFLISSLIFLATYTFNLSVINRKKKLPPGPNGLPLLGSLITIGNRPHESLTRLAKTYGPLMSVKFGLVNIVVASSAEMAEEILQRHDQEFLGRPIPQAFTAGKGYELSMPFLSSSPRWRKIRKICHSQIFTPRRLDALQELRNQMMQSMVEHLIEAREGGEAAFIGRYVFGITLNSLSNMMFTLDMFDLESDATKELKVLIEKIMEFGGKPNIADYFPFLKRFDPQRIKREIKVSYDRLHELVEKIIERRVRRRSCGLGKSGDFLDVLLDAMEEQGNEGLDHMEVKVLLMDLLIGGTDTTTTTIEWAMAELLRNPTILSKTKQELSDKILAGNAVKEHEIAHLPYLEAVIKETMRLHPTVPLLLPHLALEEVEICGYIIPKHTRVFVNTWSILRDDAHWNEPTVFKPERFLDSEIDFQGKDFSFTPFGAGRRQCPGMNLAVRMVSLLLANLVHNFDWKLPNEMKPEEMDMADKFGITMQKAEPLVAIPI